MTKYILEIATTGNEKSSRLEAALSAAVVEAVLTLGAKMAGVEVSTALTKMDEAPAGQ